MGEVWIWEPAQVGVVRAHCGCEVLTYTVQATWNDFATSCNCLIVQAGIGCGPFQVLLG